MAKINLSENALKVLEKRYLKRNAKGELIETPEELFRRVADYVAQGELKHHDSRSPDDSIKDQKNYDFYKEEFYRLMTEMLFLPNSPTLMNAGNDLGNLSACFVLPIGDSIEEIYKAVSNSALIYKSGGGCGFDFSALRPAGSMVQSTQGVASGAISFMRCFDTTIDVIKQGGKRRGAAIAILRIDHPEILQFIDCKADNKTFSNFNISISITDKFMEALENNESYDLIDPKTKKVISKLEAKMVWNKLVDNAWKNGDPGIIFIDEINRHNPIPEQPIKATNPCGEQPLSDNESCNLGSINLPKYFKKNSEILINEKELSKDVKTAIRFLDDVIEMNKFPLPEIAEQSRKTRKIGLGVMGWADLLTMGKIPYNSGTALRIAKKLMRFIKDTAIEATQELAKERGEFPAFPVSVFKDEELKRRNAALITIAPTGTISMIADTSSGIEPNFSLAFTKHVMEGEKLLYTNKVLEDTLKEAGIYSKKLIQRIADNGGSLKGIDEIPDAIKKVFVISHEISPEYHIKMQAAFQKSVCNAVSKTINFDGKATKDDIDKAFKLAHEENVKGITVYRDGSKEDQVLQTAKSYEKENGNHEIQRPDKLIGLSYRYDTGCGGLFITINETADGVPFELFATLGKSGGCPKASMEGIGRMVSLAFRNGIKPEKIIKQLLSIGCHKPIGLGPKKVLSCSDAIAKAIKRYLEEKQVKVDVKPAIVLNTTVEEEKTEKMVEKQGGGACPECGGPIEYSEGCAKCPQCSWSQCS
jgi:ribonucleoside-diphosphate reductase alpha chain